MPVVYVPDVKGYTYEFKSTAGLVGRDLTKRAIKLMLLAKKQVGKKTGFLALSIGWSIHTAPTGPYISVGSSAAHAFMHHQGTRPHVITPRRPNGVLRFSSQGRIVYARRVMHPGTKPNHYLTDNLPNVVYR